MNEFLIPFLSEFGGHTALIGFDVINEPEWIVSSQDGGDWESVNDPTKAEMPVPGESMKAFITECITTIRAYAPGKLVTVGISAKFIPLVRDLNIDYFALHHYPWLGELKDYLRLLPQGKPWSLEEYPTNDTPISISGYHDLTREGCGTGSMLWNLSPGIDKFTFSCAERDAKLLELREWVDRHAQDIIGGVNLPEFVLQIPKDYGLIHIPLKVTEVDCKAMELKTIGDAFDALGGAENVHFLITRDCPAGVWRSFLGEQHRGGLADRMLTDDMGIITVMKNPVTLHLKGEALGTDGVSAINLCRGINLVGVPLKDERLKRVGDLFRLAGCENKIAVIIVLDNGVFRVVARPDDPAGNIPITCGQSFIITAREACVAEIRGEAWDNVPNGLAAAPLMALAGHTVDGGTPVLAVHGAVIDEVTGTAKDGFRIIVKNRSTGAMLNTLSGGDPPLGSYSVTFVDVPQVERSETPIYRGRAARVGDILEITVESPSPLIGVQPLRHIVSTDDVKASQIRLPDLVAYRIPTETKLLPNYPNPFNPETWIPYRLAKDASVMLTIYDTTGAVVRTLLVGHQPAAVYESKDKAIYWDGRNDWGEQVASGVYFYTLRANDFTATRKMIILKSPQFDR